MSQHRAQAQLEEAEEGEGAAQQLGLEFGSPSPHRNPDPIQHRGHGRKAVEKLSGTPGPEYRAICGRVVKSKETEAALALEGQPSDCCQLTYLDTSNPQTRSPSSSPSKSLFS